MKRIFIFLISASLTLSSCNLLKQGVASLDQEQLLSAATNAKTALTLTDAQIIELSEQSIALMDSENTIDNGAYAARLKRLVNDVQMGDINFNFKVYKTDEVNAFACGDGSVRVYSGLMDVMDDAELVAIIGHEIGHVVHKDTKTAMRNAYLAAAARNAISSTGGVIGTLSQSVIGDIAESYLSAQYSQKQEYAADAYGYQFAIDCGYSKYSMYNSLQELLKLSGGSSSQASKVAQMFSSHPGTEERAAIMKEKADADK